VSDREGTGESMSDGPEGLDPRDVLTEAEIAACLEEGADPAVVAWLVRKLSVTEGSEA